MRVQAGLKPADWTHWGQWTTFKQNAAKLLAKELRPAQIIYCSPLTDPYQPAEEQSGLMPGILEAVAASPPQVFVIQTRGPLILRDLDLLHRIPVRVSFSVTTDDDRVRQVFEPHCASIDERFETIRALRAAGIEVFATLAPLLPCNPKVLAERAIRATGRTLIADPFHVRALKPAGATTRGAAIAIAARHGWTQWLDPNFQQQALQKIADVASYHHLPAGFGVNGFSYLTHPLRRP